MPGGLTVENALNRNGDRRWSALIVTTVLSAIVVPGGLLVAVPYLLVHSRLDLLNFDLGALRILGTVPIIVGTAVLAWCTGGFVVFGKGTPNPVDPPRHLVARGIYRRVRNPMYLSMGFIVAGEAIVLGSITLVGYLVVIMAVFHVFVVSYEEPTLRRHFGGSYEEYRKQVPRWIPKL
jgi:protein-S-isoprenylcysteine O-methyltransferase Ste14